MRPLIVVGSANQDIVAHVSRIPGPGETLLGTSVSYLPGGKGLNQACAAGAVFPNVRFVGGVGADDAGARLIARLHEYGVDTAGLIEAQGVPTGTAHISVEDSGMNSIIVIQGANACVTPDYVDEAFEAFGGLVSEPVTVLQGEIPLESSLQAAKLTRALGGQVVLNLAPVAVDVPKLLEYADPLVVNEYEAGLLSGEEAPETWESAEATAVKLLNLSRSVIVTLGAMGSVVAVSKGGGAVELERIAATPMDTVDSTGAGDAFVGVLAGALCAGRGLLEAAKTASHAASLTVTKVGASESYVALRDVSL